MEPTRIADAPLPDLVPARMLNEYAYCPRLAYLEWVQGEFAESADTVEGRFQHRRVDSSGGELPSPSETDKDPAKNSEEGGKIHARSVMISDNKLGIIARIDLVEGDAKSVMPVDYKHGAVPENPERSWEPDRVQLCAQALALRANGYSCLLGVIYYIASKTRVEVEFNKPLIARTVFLLKALRQMAAQGKMPFPLADSPKCVGCSLAGICLPDETNFLASDATATVSDEDRVRRLVPARDDALPLYVQEQGARISRKGEVLEVWLKDKKLGESRLFETSQVGLFGNIQVSTQALAQMLDNGIPVAFFSTGGWFRGIAHGMWHKNVELRRFQYHAAGDKEMSLAFARSFTSAKIENSRTILMRNHPATPQDVVVSLAGFAAKARDTAAMDTLLGIEGTAARLYFSAFGGMLKNRSEKNDWVFDFDGRNRRPPVDAVNALLSYAYSMLAKDLTVAAMAVGFDPFLGFYHQPRYGRPALALDLMEEFRPIIADSVVLAVINNGMLSSSDFIRRGQAVALTPAGRKKFIQAYERRLDSLITHPVFGYRISYRRVLEVQARLLGRVLSGEFKEYPAFRTR